MPSVLSCSSTPSHRVRFHWPVAEVAVGLGHVAGLREQQRDGVLGRGQHVRLRRVDDHDAAPGGGLDVDVVEPDAGPADDHELVARFEHLGGDLGGAADHERRRAADRLEQLARRQAEPDVDLEPGGAHGLEPAVGELLTDEDALHRSITGSRLFAAPGAARNDSAGERGGGNHSGSRDRLRVAERVGDRDRGLLALGQDVHLQRRHLRAGGRARFAGHLLGREAARGHDRLLLDLARDADARVAHRGRATRRRLGHGARAGPLLKLKVSAEVGCPAASKVTVAVVVPPSPLSISAPSKQLTVTVNVVPAGTGPLTVFTMVSGACELLDAGLGHGAEPEDAEGDRGTEQDRMTNVTTHRFPSRAGRIPRDPSA